MYNVLCIGLWRLLGLFACVYALRLSLFFFLSIVLHAFDCSCTACYVLYMYMYIYTHFFMYVIHVHVYVYTHCAL